MQSRKRRDAGFMMKRLRRLLFPFLRGAVAVLALLGYLTATIGFPAPIPVSTSAHGKEAKHVHVKPCGCVVTDDDESSCCCSRSPCCSKPNHEVEPQDASQDGFVFLIGEQVRKCHGFDELWSAIAAALPLPPPVACVHDDRSTFQHFSRQHFPEGLAHRPPAPPPRG
jgi:hypothetical protein